MVNKCVYIYLFVKYWQVPCGVGSVVDTQLFCAMCYGLCQDTYNNNNNNNNNNTLLLLLLLLLVISWVLCNVLPIVS